MIIALRRTGPATPGHELSLGRRYLLLQGAQNGQLQTFTGKMISVSTKGTAQPSTVTVSLGRSLRADDYTGALVAGVSSGADALDVPVEIQVRAGPVLPLLVLIVAVLLGMGLAWIGGRLLPRARFDRQATDFNTKVKALPANERIILLERWPQIRSERNDNLAIAKQHLDALMKGIDALAECRDVQDEVLRTPDFDKLMVWKRRVDGAVAKVATAIRAFQAPYDVPLAGVYQARDEFDVAHKVLDSIESLQNRAQTASRLGQPYEDFLAAARAVQAALNQVSPDPTQAAPDLAGPMADAQAAYRRLEQAPGGPLATPAGQAVAAGIGLPQLVRPILVPPAGSGGWTAVLTSPSVTAAAAWLLGPAATAVIAITLLAIGFKTTYLDNPTFGAQASDWIGLVIWGLAAYGTRQALTGLGTTKAS